MLIPSGGLLSAMADKWQSCRDGEITHSHLRCQHLTGRLPLHEISIREAVGSGWGHPTWRTSIRAADAHDIAGHRLTARGITLNAPHAEWWAAIYASRIPTRESTRRWTLDVTEKMRCQRWTSDSNAEWPWQMAIIAAEVPRGKYSGRRVLRWKQRSDDV